MSRAFRIDFPAELVGLGANPGQRRLELPAAPVGVLELGAGGGGRLGRRGELPAHGLELGASLLQGGADRGRARRSLGLEHREADGVSGARDLARPQTELPLA